MHGFRAPVVRRRGTGGRRPLSCAPRLRSVAPGAAQARWERLHLTPNRRHDAGDRLAPARPLDREIGRTTHVFRERLANRSSQPPGQAPSSRPNRLDSRYFRTEPGRHPPLRRVRSCRRQLAAELGCSPMTPCHYFRDREAIIAAVRAAAFARFADAMAAAATVTDPVARLGRLGEAFLRHARTDPHGYRIMFELAQPRARDYPALDRARGASRAPPHPVDQAQGLRLSPSRELPPRHLLPPRQLGFLPGNAHISPQEHLRRHRDLEAANPTAHTLACLGFAALVAETVARLATGSAGAHPWPSPRRRRLTPLGRGGQPPAGPAPRAPASGARRRRAPAPSRARRPCRRPAR